MRIIEIGSLDEVSVYSGLTERQLLYAGEGRGLFIAESVNVIKSAIAAGYSPVSLLAERGRLCDAEECLSGFPEDTPVYTGTPELIEGLTGYRLHRGILAAMERKPLPCFRDIADGASRIAVLEGVTDPTNVGAIFRSAAALGMDAVLVSSNCCDPLHRRAARVSTGSVFKIPWAVLPCMDADRNRADISAVKEMGFTVCAMALSSSALPIDDPSLASHDKLALVLGSEGRGLRQSTVADCDITAIIPMSNGVDSLNVAAAAAVAFWTLGNRDRRFPNTQKGLPAAGK